ncbi:hypothetical protein CAAN4_H14202 [[Candida] anglica]|uniref:Uncharacterized protein n=1 Tax=[Candida] anglica TaxID=148631 RepID=A0ABP0EKQ5_9ASCO
MILIRRDRTSWIPFYNETWTDPIGKTIRPLPCGAASRSAGTPWATSRGGSLPSTRNCSTALGLLVEELGTTQWLSPSRGQRSGLQSHRELSKYCPTGFVSRSAGTPWATSRGGLVPSTRNCSTVLCLTF